MADFPVYQQRPNQGLQTAVDDILRQSMERRMIQQRENEKRQELVMGVSSTEAATLAPEYLPALRQSKTLDEANAAASKLFGVARSRKAAQATTAEAVAGLGNSFATPGVESGSGRNEAAVNEHSGAVASVMNQITGQAGAGNLTPEMVQNLMTQMNSAAVSGGSERRKVEENRAAAEALNRRTTDYNQAAQSKQARSDFAFERSARQEDQLAAEQRAAKANTENKYETLRLGLGLPEGVSHAQIDEANYAARFDKANVPTKESLAANGALEDRIRNLDTKARKGKSVEALEPALRDMIGYGAGRGATLVPVPVLAPAGEQGWFGTTWKIEARPPSSARFALRDLQTAAQGGDEAAAGLLPVYQEFYQQKSPAMTRAMEPLTPEQAKHVQEGVAAVAPEPTTTQKSVSRTGRGQSFKGAPQVGKGGKPIGTESGTFATLKEKLTGAMKPNKTAQREADLLRSKRYRR